MRIIWWALKSRKIWVGLAGIAGAIISEKFGAEWGEKVAAGILALAGIIIAGIAWEDGQAKRRGVDAPAASWSASSATDGSDKGGGDGNRDLASRPGSSPSGLDGFPRPGR